MFHQRFGLGRHTATREVPRCCVKAHREHREPARRQRRIIWKIAHAQCNVEVLADQVDPSRRQIDFKRNGWVFGNEFGQQILGDAGSNVLWGDSDTLAGNGGADACFQQILDGFNRFGVFLIEKLAIFVRYQRMIALHDGQA